MFDRQLQHLALLAALIAALMAVITLIPGDSVMAGELWGISTPIWFAIAIATPILHQVYVWLIWRLELHHGWVSQTFGERGFGIYAAGFTVLFVARLISIILLAWSNRGTLGLNPNLAYVLALVLLVPAIYTFYSVKKYFGLKRAYGIDHFDSAYRDMPFVSEGMFRYSSNAMYFFGLLILWTPGLLFLSQAAILAALFNHIYIWVHYYCTELSDINRIYGNSTP